MRILFTAILLIVSLIGYSQESDSVLLRWNIDQGEKLAYALIQEKQSINLGDIPVEDFFKEIPKKGRKRLKVFEKLYKQFESKTGKPNMYSELSRKQDGTLLILMNKIAPFAEKPFGEDTDLDKQRELDKLSGRLSFLEGFINEKGEVSGESLHPRHKSLMSLIFQLPQQAVSEGDTWEIFSSFITVHNPADLISSEVKSSAQLLEISQKKSETIARISYKISEKKEIKSMPTSLNQDHNKDETSFAQVVYHAIGEFSIERGRWISYTGMVISKIEGRMNISALEYYSLSEIE